MQSLLEFYEGYVLHPTTLTMLALAGGLLAVLYALNHTRTDGADADKRLDAADWMGLTGSFMTNRYRPMGRAVLVLAVIMGCVLFVLGLFALLGLWYALWDVVDPTNPHALAGRGIDPAAGSDAPVAATDGAAVVPQDGQPGVEAGTGIGTGGQEGTVPLFSPGDNIRGIAFALAAIFGLPFLVWRTLVAQKQSDVSEQSLITERISKAVEQLGAEKEVSFIGRPVTVWTGVPQEHSVRAVEGTEGLIPERSVVLFQAGDSEQVYIEEEDTVETTYYDVAEYRQWPAEETFIERQNEPVPWGETDHVVEKGDWQGFKQTEPNIEVRVGAIYALERIAQDSLRDHVQIMEILTAYVRENSPASSAQDHGLGDWEPLKDGVTEEEREAYFKMRQQRFANWPAQPVLSSWSKSLNARIDIQAVISVVGRRDPKQRKREEDDTRHHLKGYRLDFRKTNLQGIDAHGLYFDEAQFSQSRIEGADFSGAQLNNCDFSMCSLEGCSMSNSKLNGANFETSKLEAATFSGSVLHRSSFRSARLEAAIFEDADLTKADLAHTNLELANFVDSKMHRCSLIFTRVHDAFMINVNLQEADFDGAEILRTYLTGADLSKVVLRPKIFGASTNIDGMQCNQMAVKAVDFCDFPDLTQAQVDQMYGDGSTKLPEGLKQPEHWPEKDLNWSEFLPRWEAWKVGQQQKSNDN